MEGENYYTKFLGKRVIITTVKNNEYKGRVTQIEKSWLSIIRERKKDWLSNQLIPFEDIKEIEII